MHGLQRLISETIHILPNLLSCIDLIFTDQPDLAVDGGAIPCLHFNCYRQIIYCKFNLMTENPPQHSSL